MAKKHSRRRTLRNYGQVTLTLEEAQALRDKAIDLDSDPIAIAVLGAVLVEHELDKLLRRRFRRIGDEDWELLISENGPLASLYSKGLLAHAFGIIDDK